MSINQENIQFSTTILSTSLSSSSLNVTGQNISRSDYQTTICQQEYIDKNANSIADNAAEYDKSCEDRLVHLIDKLHIENGKNQIEQQASSTHNRITVAAVTPTLLLANHISPSILSSTEKSHNVIVKPEVCVL